MEKFKCPHCGIKLGNFMYAYECPNCHGELKHNTRALVLIRKKGSRKPKWWPVRIFFRIVRFVEG
jgi:hypothetical protein